MVEKEEAHLQIRGISPGLLDDRLTKAQEDKALTGRNLKTNSSLIRPVEQNTLKKNAETDSDSDGPVYKLKHGMQPNLSKFFTNQQEYLQSEREDQPFTADKESYLRSLQPFCDPYEQIKHTIIKRESKDFETIPLKTERNPLEKFKESALAKS